MRDLADPGTGGDEGGVGDVAEDVQQHLVREPGGVAQLLLPSHPALQCGVAADQATLYLVRTPPCAALDTPAPATLARLSIASHNY